MKTRLVLSITDTVIADIKISRSDHLQAFDDVFVDSSGSLNTLAGWERGDLQLVSVTLSPHCNASLTSSSNTTHARHWPSWKILE